MLPDKQTSNDNAIRVTNTLSICKSLLYEFICGFNASIAWSVSRSNSINEITAFHSKVFETGDIKTLKFSNSKYCFLLDYNDIVWQWNIGGDIIQVKGIPKIVAMDIIDEHSIFLIGENGLLYTYNHGSRTITTSKEVTDALRIFYDKYYCFIICKKGKILCSKNLQTGLLFQEIDHFNTFEICSKSNVVKISSLQSFIFFLLANESVYCYTCGKSMHFLGNNIVDLGLGWFLNCENQLMYFHNNSLKKIKHVKGIEISDFTIIDFNPLDQSNVAILGSNNELGIITHTNNNTFNYTCFDVTDKLPKAKSFKSARK